MQAFMRELIKESLRDWFKKEKWVRISTSGNIAGPCGTSKNKKNPDRCLPAAKARSLSKAERAATARKKKKAGAKGKTVVKNTKKATVSIKKETKGAPKGHYFTKSGNLVKGRLTKDARERGARLSDPKDKQRSKVPPVTQYNEEISDANYVKGMEVIKSTLSKEGGAAGLKPIVDALKGLGFKKDDVVALLKKMTKVEKHTDGDYILVPINENLDPSYKHDGKSAPFGSGYRPVKKEDIKNLIVGLIHEMKNNLVTFGYDLDAIQDVVDHLESNYKEGQDYELHIQRGDDLPNAITFKNTALQKDYDLNDMLNVAQSDEDRYDAYTDDNLNEKDDRCTRIAKRKYDTWPSAYASGAVVRCRRGEIWKGVKEETIDEMNCEHGKYYCNHDKKYKCRKGPKKSR